MLYYLSSRDKMDLCSVLFKYMRDMVKDTIDGSPKLRKWIHMGRLISYMPFERKLIQVLMEANLTKN